MRLGKSVPTHKNRLRKVVGACGCGLLGPSGASAVSVETPELRDRRLSRLHRSLN